MGDVATIRNGTDVDRLVGTIEAIQSDSAWADFTFKATSTWLGGTHNTGKIHGFTHAGAQNGSRSEGFVLHGNEPPVLLGSNAGPDAVELLLQTLCRYFQDTSPVRDCLANAVPAQTTLEIS